MNQKTVPSAEIAFRAIAAALDELGEEKAPLFLAKLSLILSHELNDPDRLLACIARARASAD